MNDAKKKQENLSHLPSDKEAAEKMRVAHHHSQSYYLLPFMVIQILKPFTF